MSARRGCCGVSIGSVIAVVVVIGVMVAVMLPAAMRARESFRVPSCENNMKEMAIALQIYWSDYNGKLPSSMLVNHSKSWNKSDFLEFATKTGSLPPKGTPRTYAQVLYSYMKNKDIIVSPSDPEGDATDPDAPVSYWWKCAIDRAWYGDHCAKPCRTEKDFAYQEDQIVFYEHCGWHLDDTSGLKSGTQIHAAYLDSHVRMTMLRNATSGDPKTCAANSDGEPMYFNYDNKTKSQSKGPARWIDPARYSDKL